MPTPFVFETTCDSAIVAAVAGLAGAVIGAGIGAFTTYRVAVRTEKQKRQDEKRQKDIEVKRAARLIDTEFLTASAVIEQTIRQNRWGHIPVSTDAWTKYSPTLAPDLTDDEWNAVSTAALMIGIFLGLSKETPDTVTGEDLGGDTAELLQPILGDVKNGRRALLKWHKDPEAVDKELAHEIVGTPSGPKTGNPTP